MRRINENKFGIAFQTIVSLQSQTNNNLKHNKMKKIIAILVLAASISSCASSTNASKHQNHLKSSPQHNFKHNDNGGCNWHNN
jgi:hypothetical protein